MASKVRVRFAPSPTGPLHIGGVRTALYNYLFAKKHGGDFLLRIEDTDQGRFVEGAEKYIISSLEWCGISFDEGPGKEGDFGPYRQSERKELYKKYAEELIEKGHAYLAFDEPESLDQLRKQSEANGQVFIYNWQSRTKLNNSLVLTPKETSAKIDAGKPYVVRFKPPVGEVLFLHDEIRGGIEINTQLLDDKILFKSDGMPTYHLANIVDDHLMQISHVIRGEEWLPSLALHVLLYQAFGWETPKFAHLPLILKPQGKGKLSKRDGDKGGFPVFPLEWKDPKSGEISTGYREEGYLPQAVVNMLAFLGWNPGTEQEIFNLKELIQTFELQRVHKSGAKFDPEKTNWFQHHYFQEQNNNNLAEQFQEILKKKEIQVSTDYVEEVISILKERASFVSDFWELGSYYFTSPTQFDEKAAKKAWKEDTGELMKEIAAIIDTLAEFDRKILEEVLKTWISDRGIGFGKIMQPLRLTLVGAMKGPDLFHIMTSIGKKETVKRIKTAVEKFSKL